MDDAGGSNLTLDTLARRRRRSCRDWRSWRRACGCHWLRRGL